MGATLGLTDNKTEKNPHGITWMPHRAMFDIILEEVAKRTVTISPFISDLFAHSTSEYTGGMLFIDDWTNPNDFHIVLDAVLEYKKELLQEHPKPYWLDGRLMEIDELIELLALAIEELIGELPSCVENIRTVWKFGHAGRLPEGQ